MKISKSRLRRIIKEERSRLLSEVTPAERDEARRLARLDTEGFFGGHDPAEALPHLKKALSILARNTGNKESMNAVIAAIEALEHPEYTE